MEKHKITELVKGPFRWTPSCGNIVSVNGSEDIVERNSITDAVYCCCCYSFSNGESKAS